MIKQIDYINTKMSGKEIGSPQFLYKYRPFDKFTFDMLDKGYVYLCPANHLDDPSECKVDFSYKDIYDVQSGLIKHKCVESILEQLKPFTSEENFREVCNIVKNTMTQDGLIKRNYLLEVSPDIQYLIPNRDIAPIITLLGDIPERLDEPQQKENLEKLIELAYDARECMGICSLSALKNCEEMWKNYASNSTGYCIEYDMRDYDKLYALYPVLYNDSRKINVISNLISSMIGEMVYILSYNQLNADRSQYLQMFLTKDEKWSYQNEWRLLGDAGQNLQAPKINAIYLGKNVLEEDKIKMISYCQSHNIVVNLNKQELDGE